MKKLFQFFIFLFIIFNISLGYTLTVNDFSIDVEEGIEVTATATVEEGQSFLEWEVLTPGFELLNPELIKITFKMPAYDLSIRSTISQAGARLIVNPGEIEYIGTKDSSITVTSPDLFYEIEYVYNDDAGTIETETISAEFSHWELVGDGKIKSADQSTTEYTFGQNSATLTAHYKSNSITLPNPSRVGYIFKGWYVSETGTMAGEAGASYTVESDATLSAEWKAIAVNAPILGEGMTPVNWNGNEWEDTQESEWDYNYSMATAGHETVAGDGTAKWANARTEDGSMYVWIPRFSYKITSGEHQKAVSWSSDLYTEGDTMGKIEIKFTDATEDDNEDEYLSHPAFTLGDQELTGFWIAKYEASKGEGNVPQSKPGETSWNRESVSSIYNYAKNLNELLDSHLIKNSEWGAVAYLTNAIGKIPYPNNSYNDETCITGMAGDNQNGGNTSSDWNTEAGVKASTTHNVYGVYDMSGGVWEYVAAYYTDGNTTYLSSDKLNQFAGALVENKESKYVEPYTYADGNLETVTTRGDAVYETSSGTSESSQYAWDGDTSYLPTYALPVFIRGGYDGFAGSGMYAYYGTSGADLSNMGFRVTLAPKTGASKDTYSIDTSPVSYANSLSEAVSIAQTGNTITVLATPEIEGEVIIPEGKNITLNLNGKTLSSDSANFITINGELTITDTTGGTIVSTALSDRTTQAKAIIVSNSGKLILDKGTIRTEGLTSYGIYSESETSTITIGADDGKDLEIPKITGGTYGINSIGTVNYYDGIIEGGIKPINAVTVNVAYGKTIIYEYSYTNSGLTKYYDTKYNDSEAELKNFVNGENSTIVGATWSEDDSLAFDGTDDYINTGESNYNKVTLEAVFVVNQIGGNQHIVSNIETGGYGIGVRSNNHLTITGYDSKEGYKYADSIAEAEAGRKYHIIGTYDGSYITLYVDGVKSSTTEIPNGIKTTENNTVLALGVNPAGSSAPEHFLNGNLYLARVYDKALTAEEILANYNASMTEEKSLCYLKTEAGTKYIISYDANGGENTPEDQEKEFGVSLIITSQVPTRDGYTFLGWATTNDAVEAEYHAGENFELDKTTTLYAVWEGSSKYLLTVYYDKYTKTETMYNGEEITIEVASEDENSIFDSWSVIEGITLDPEQGKSPSLTFTMPNNAVTIRANYIDKNAVNTVSLNSVTAVMTVSDRDNNTPVTSGIHDGNIIIRKGESLDLTITTNSDTITWTANNNKVTLTNSSTSTVTVTGTGAGYVTITADVGYGVTVSETIFVYNALLREGYENAYATETSGDSGSAVIACDLYMAVELTTSGRLKCNEHLWVYKEAKYEYINPDGRYVTNYYSKGGKPYNEFVTNSSKYWWVFSDTL